MTPTNLQNPLVELILEGKVMDGDTVRVSKGEDGLLLMPPAHTAEASAGGSKAA